MRTPIVVAVALGALTVSACGSSSKAGSGASSASTKASAVNTNAPGTGATATSGAGAASGAGSLPAVTGAFGAKPTVAKGEGSKPADLQVKVLSPGNGPTVAAGDTAYVNYFGQLWEGTPFDNSFDRGQPFDFPVGKGKVIPGWDEGVAGQKVGSRIELIVPPAKGYGAQGSPPVIPANSTLVFVVDVLAAFNTTSSAQGTDVPLNDASLPKITAEPGKKPSITMPSGGTAPSDLVVKTLIDGNGAVVEKGKTLVAQYVGVIWASGKQFDASWDRGAPAAFPIGVGKVIPGWDEGLVGTKIGSRVLLSIPPAKGYGANGNSRAGISGTDTLVFVVDVLGAF